eukprot:gene16111-16288_t
MSTPGPFTQYREARARVGLVPQELHTDSFETVWATVRHSRGLFGKPPNDALIERVLRDLSLWDKRNNKMLRRDMWSMVERLRAEGVTIILTTHYIEEAEELADRIGVISKGEIILVEDKAALMQKLGSKELQVELQAPLKDIPAVLAAYHLELSEDGLRLTYRFDARREGTGIPDLMRQLAASDQAEFP